MKEKGEMNGFRGVNRGMWVWFGGLGLFGACGG